VSLDELGNRRLSRSEVKGLGRKEEKFTPMLWVSHLVVHGVERMGGGLLDIVYEARFSIQFRGSGASMGTFYSTKMPKGVLAPPSSSKRCLASHGTLLFP
jgi:hypothetical protein